MDYPGVHHPAPRLPPSLPLLPVLAKERRLGPTNKRNFSALLRFTYFPSKVVAVDYYQENSTITIRLAIYTNM